MTAALNFFKNVGLSIFMFVVLNGMLLIWLVAALFHGVNRASANMGRRRKR